MPLGIRLRKGRQYNVSTKSLYVLTVELLDSSTIDCTLTADSTGRDCLENICQRLGLQQPDFFGLRFEARRCLPRIRWVELDKPVKKQLEKYGDDHKLYLGVMFYITDVHLIHDEITRYQYFLQLKQDVLEGKLACNQDQAISLAAYSLQAEFGDHDPERHTVEYLKEFALLPKGETDSSLIELVIRHHVTLQSLSPTLAEVYYILEAQKLDGYGVDFFPAKTESGHDCFVGSSLLGIVIRFLNPPGVRYCRWSDITNLVNQKRIFTIECQRAEDSANYVLSEQELAKYVWKTCVSQHSFFKAQTATLGISDKVLVVNNNSNEASPGIADGNGNAGSVQNATGYALLPASSGANSGMMSMNGNASLDLEIAAKARHQQQQQHFQQQAQHQMQQQAQQQMHQQAQHQMQQQVQQQLQQQAQQQQQLQMQQQAQLRDQQQFVQRIPLSMSNPGLNSEPSMSSPGMLPHVPSSSSLQSQSQQHHVTTMSTGLQSSETYANLPGSSPAMGGSSSGYSSPMGSQLQLRRTDMLPSYRPAPDYETAIRQKYHDRMCESAAACSAGGKPPATQLPQTSAYQIHQQSPQNAQLRYEFSTPSIQQQLQQQQQMRYLYQQGQRGPMDQQHQMLQQTNGSGFNLDAAYQRNSQPDFRHLTAQMSHLGICDRQ